ncbi:MAG: SDR family oxidoreductase [Actinobacteria bacterium]|nr:SDR family oxidoreductase [Actinomycetota bacterium]
MTTKRSRVLVTGNLGYIGSVLAPYFERAGHTVVGLDTGLFAGCDLGPPPSVVPTLAVDLRDVTVDDLRGFDAIVHLAALSNDPLGNLEPGLTWAINHAASITLAQRAKEAGVRRFLYASSCSVYGAAEDGATVDEDAPMRPTTPYAASKVRVEDDLHDLADSDFSPVYLRNATVFGVSPRLRADVVLNNLVGTAYLDREVRVLSDGSPWRPLVHVQDVAAAFLAALEAERDAIHDVAVNVGSDECNYRVRELAELAGEVTGCPVAILGEADPDARSYRVDFSRLGQVLPAFEARWTARAGAEELQAAYVAHGLTREQFATRLTRLARIDALLNDGLLDHSLRFVERPAIVA